MANDKDYTGQGTAAEVADSIDSEEQLVELLKKQGIEPTNDNASGTKDDDDDEGGSAQADDTTDDDDETAKQSDDNGDKSSEGDKGDDDTPEYPTMIHYLDDRFKLGMNLDAVPGEMSTEEQIQAVGDILERATIGFNRKLAEYSEVQKLLQDEDVVNFLRAKSEGKTMADIAKEYSVTPDGLENEQVIRKELELQYKDMDEQERTELINDLIDGYKDKGKLEKVADLARKRLKAAEQARTIQQQQQEQIAFQQREEQRKQEIAAFQNYLGTKKDVHGITLSDEMKKGIFQATTQIVDEEGNTYLDKALQSDEGVLLAALGVLYMDRMLGAKDTSKINRQNKTIVDRLFTSADQLQSDSGKGEQDNKFNTDIANMF